MTGYITFYSSAEINELELSQIATDFLKQAGIVRQGGNLGFAAAQLSPLDGLKYNITSGGTFYITNDTYADNGSNPKYWMGRFSGATETLTFAANSSGSTRIDLIAIKVDTTVTDANADNTGVASLVVVQGTPGAGVPATPANHIALYQVTIANGETEITDTEVTDVRTEAYLKIQSSLTLSGNEIMPSNKILDQAFDGWIPSGETWTYASADDPTFTFTIAGDKSSKYCAGQRIKLTQATGGIKYFIITKVEYSAPNTTVTVYGGTDYDLINQTISSPYYSREKAPTGFPLNPAKWTVSVTPSGSQTSAANGTWYNPGTTQLSIPVGLWYLEYNCEIFMNNGSGNADLWVTISDANNTGVDNGANTRRMLLTGVLGGMVVASLSVIFETTTKVTRYLNLKSTNAGTPTIAFQQNGAGYFRVVCAYL